MSSTSSSLSASESNAEDSGISPALFAVLQDFSNSVPQLIPFSTEPASCLTLSSELEDRTCVDCRKIVMKLCEGRRPSEPTSWYFDSENHHDGLLPSLIDSSESCLICAMIIEQLQFDHSEHLVKHTYYRLAIKGNNPHMFGVWITNDMDAKKPRREDVFGEFELYRCRGPRCSPEADYRIIYANSLHASNIPQLVPPGFPGFKAAIDKIRNWIHDCERRHVVCQSARQLSVLPKRVLKIAENGQVSLYCTEQAEIAPFVTLSYRWGDGLPLKTTKETIDNFSTGIETAKLPKTLKDAVCLTHSLGFEFLWIDALCIVQDDDDDWAEESAKMAGIFWRSSLNIFAADAKTCQSGILEKAAPHLLEINTTSTESTERLVLVGRPSFPFVMNHSNCGLESRGWVFQESLSSICSLYIGRRHGLVWDCCAMQDTIDGNRTFTSADSHLGEPLTLKRSWAETLSLTTGEADLRSWDYPIAWPPSRGQGPRNDQIGLQRSFANIWYDWVEQYTLRNLTIESDRLPAIGGLASFVASKSQMKYAAGLWQEDIIPGLSWHAVPGKVRRIPGSSPSWSWASITGYFYYPRFFSMAVTYRGVVRKCPELDLKIKHISVDEVNPGKFGRVRRGEIKAVGFMKRPSAVLGEKRWMHRCSYNLDEQVARESGSVNPSRDQEVSDRSNGVMEHYQFLRLMSVWRDKKWDAGPVSYFLIIEATGREQNEFQRVGIGSINLYSDSHYRQTRYRNTEEPEPSLTEEEVWADAELVELLLV